MSIESWLMTKSIESAESSVLAQLTAKDGQALLPEKIDGALQRLDRLLDGPDEVSRHLFLEYELKGAIARRPLSLPARLLLLRLLGLQEKHEEALECEWDLLEAFSFRPDLVSPPLYRAFLDEAAKTSVRPERPTFLQLRRDPGKASDCNPRAIWCSPTAIGVEWAWTSRSLFYGRSGEISVTVHDWSGKFLLSTVPSAHGAIEMLTSDFAVYRDQDDLFRVFSLSERREVAESPLGEPTFRALFLPMGRELSALPLYRRSRFDGVQLTSGDGAYSNVMLRLGTCEVREERFQPGGDGVDTFPTTQVAVTCSTVNLLSHSMPRVVRPLRTPRAFPMAPSRGTLVHVR